MCVVAPPLMLILHHSGHHIVDAIYNDSRQLEWGGLLDRGSLRPTLAISIQQTCLMASTRLDQRQLLSQAEICCWPVVNQEYCWGEIKSYWPIHPHFGLFSSYQLTLSDIMRRVRISHAPSVNLSKCHIIMNSQMETLNTSGCRHGIFHYHQNLIKELIAN